MNVDRVLDDVVTKIVRFAVHDTGLDSAAGHPNGETFEMVIATVIFASEFALAVDRTSRSAMRRANRQLATKKPSELLHH